MHCYVSAVRDDGRDVRLLEVEDEVGIYRGRDDAGRVWARTDSREVDLGVTDYSVSRMRESGPPVRIHREDGTLYLHNVDNESTLRLRSAGRTTELSKGEREPITADAKVELGFDAAIRVSVQRDSEQRTTRRTVSDDGRVASDEIPVSAYVTALCDHFRSASRESTADARTRARQLFDTITEYPVESEAYDSVRGELDRRLEQLANLDAAELDRQRIRWHDELATRIEDLYDRQGSSDSERVSDRDSAPDVEYEANQHSDPTDRGTTGQ